MILPLLKKVFNYFLNYENFLVFSRKKYENPVDHFFNLWLFVLFTIYFDFNHGVFMPSFFNVCGNGFESQS